jgi:hypothetical protein
MMCRFSVKGQSHLNALGHMRWCMVRQGLAFYQHNYGDSELHIFMHKVPDGMFSPELNVRTH